MKTASGTFRGRVYAALATVPRGRVTTYGALARAVGCRSPRAVGGALRENPFAPMVPCHRVIAADGSPGGFQGRCSGESLSRKLALLAAEGVFFKDGRLADRRRFYDPAGGEHSISPPRPVRRTVPPTDSAR